MQFIEIEEIKEIPYFGEVFDLSVEDDNSFNVESVIVHNSACTTWNATGFGSRNKQGYFIKECASASSDKMLIADGGIKHHGDIAKALVLGADLVMIGGLLSGFADSPGAVVEHDNKKFKEFWGSASAFQSNKTSRIEGKKYLVELKNRSILHEYTSIKESLQSAISYAGGKDLSAFLSVKYV
jgi:GMP reductase